MKQQTSRGLNVALWTVQLALAATFISIGLMRLTGTSNAVETFEQVGFGQWLRYFTGAAELAGGIGVLIPRLAGLAALGLVLVMVGATVANLLVLTPMMAALTIALGVASAFVARQRWAQTRSLIRR